MLVCLDDRVLTVRSCDGAVQREVDFGGLHAVSSVRLDPSARWLAVTAVTDGGAAPDVRSNQRGDLRLIRIDLQSGERRQLTKGYAHDAVFWPDSSRIAFHTGSGPAIVDAETGREQRRWSIGRFNWGPPSISVSPGGSRLGCIKWRGDDRKMIAFDVAGTGGEPLRPSCFAYTWWDDDSLLYDHGHSLHVVDVRTGKSRRWLACGTAVAEGPTLAASVPGAAEVLGQGGATRWDAVNKPQVVGDRVIFVLTLAGTESRLGAIVSVGKDRKDLRTHAVVRDKRRLTGFSVLNDGRTFAVRYERYEGTRIVEHGRFFSGEHADSIPSRFYPLPRMSAPNFGFHAMPTGAASSQEA